MNKNNSNSKVFWKNIKQNILVNPAKCELIPDSLRDPDKINAQFLAIPGSHVVSISQLTYFFFHRFNSAIPSFKLHSITEDEVSKHIFSLKSNAAGSDNINRTEP